jgi:hypothetical protein
MYIFQGINQQSTCDVAKYSTRGKRNDEAANKTKERTRELNGYINFIAVTQPKVRFSQL